MKFKPTITSSREEWLAFASEAGKFLQAKQPEIAGLTAGREFTKLLAMAGLREMVRLIVPKLIVVTQPATKRPMFPRNAHTIKVKLDYWIILAVCNWIADDGLPAELNHLYIFQQLDYHAINITAL